MRTPEQERQFLLERSSAIGGSDVHHLLNIPPYGCRRRLWYDKKGVVADFPFTGNRNTRRGQILEPHAIAEFLAEENMQGEIMEWKVMEARRHAGAHFDHIIWPMPVEESPTRAMTTPRRGLLEVKIPNLRNFYALKATGPNHAMQLQLQWGMTMAEVTWGVLWIFNADLWRGKSWRYERDPSMVEDLLAIADNFWASLDSDRPKWDRLDPNSRQCQDCPWRRTCQGITRATPSALEDLDEPTEPPEEDESLFDAVAAYVAADARLKDAESAKAAARAEIVARLRKPRKVRCSAGTVNYYEVVVPAKVAKPVPENRKLTLRVTAAKGVSFPQDGDDYDDTDAGA